MWVAKRIQAKINDLEESGDIERLTYLEEIFIYDGELDYFHDKIETNGEIILLEDIMIGLLDEYNEIESWDWENNVQKFYNGLLAQIGL